VGLVLFFFIPETVGVGGVSSGSSLEGNENVCLFVELAVHTRQSLLASMLAGVRLDQPNMPLLP
jgi:small ligand-binding sensory domain FIST